MRPGDRAQITRAFTAADVSAFVALGGAAPASGRAPDALIGGLFSYLLGVELPGRGTNYIRQESDYLAPARLDEPLTARVEIVRVRADKALVDLETVCVDASGAVICRGRALVYVADVQTAP